MISWRQTFTVDVFCRYPCLSAGTALTFYLDSILADGALFSPSWTGVRCRWWRRVQREAANEPFKRQTEQKVSWVWRVQSNTTPNLAALTQIRTKDCKPLTLFSSEEGNCLIEYKALLSAASLLALLYCLPLRTPTGLDCPILSSLIFKNSKKLTLFYGS
jgi:hypothetical protein